MQPNLPSLAVSETLLQDTTQTFFTQEPVLFFYAAAFVAAATLWTLGVLAFGRCRSARRKRKRHGGPANDTRITPVVS